MKPTPIIAGLLAATLQNRIGCWLLGVGRWTLPRLRQRGHLPGATWCILVGCHLLAALFLCGSGRAATIPVDGYAAAVNDKVVTVAQALELMQPVERQLRQAYSGPELDVRLEAAYSNALAALIERRLIVDDFARHEWTLPDNVAEGRADEVLRNKFNNNRAELTKALEAEGLTLQEWKDELRERIIVSIMRDKMVGGKPVVSPQAVREAYEKRLAHYQAPEQVDLRMIVLHRGNTPEDAAIKARQAEEIRRLLLAGESFEELAKKLSEGPKAESGGAYGWVDPATRRPEVAEALAEMSPGEISDVIETEDEFYLVKIEARKNAGTVPFEEAEKELRDELLQEETLRLYRAWIERLKRNAYIRVY